MASEDHNGACFSIAGSCPFPSSVTGEFTCSRTSYNWTMVLFLKLLAGFRVIDYSGMSKPEEIFSGKDKSFLE